MGVRWRVSRTAAVRSLAVGIRLSAISAFAAAVIGVLSLGAASVAADDPLEKSAAGESLAAVPQGWIRTGSFDAAEAFQAAAADEHRVYVISNTQVAAYDPATGKRIALSTGPAKHLNSGFLFEGQLYCAHSNYPTKPEQSVLKVVDLSTMQLRTFKDFGASEGSLTWAVRHQGDWWCNFAYYGDDNHRTILVRFDASWQPIGRWTYPRRVIEQLGQHSLSGGIWHEGQLLVTGHDDPVIFRLRLPQEGTELEYIDQLPAPFTGQGFAVDLRRGGLIGIDRGRRQIIFASPAGETP